MTLNFEPTYKPAPQGGTTILDMAARRIRGFTVPKSGRFEAIKIHGHNQHTWIGLFKSDKEAVAAVLECYSA